jgi:3-oxoacyl-[acyl-carrier-protein] synthase II
MDALVAGTRAIGPLTRFDAARFRCRIAAEVPGLEVKGVCPAGAEGRWSRSDAMALLGAAEALRHARLDPRAQPVDLVVGGSTAGLFETEELLAALHRDAARALTTEEAAAFVAYPISATTARLDETLGPFRRARTLCTACSTGATAIATAAHWLASGRASAVLAGATDALCRLTFAGFNALGALDPEPCRPFHRRRAGLTLGEGAAFLVLEREDAARARGAIPLAELAGYAVGAEAHHITQPDPAGATAARLMRRALERAGLDAADLDYVNAHGTATPHNDRTEAAALTAALGAHARRVPISSCKGQLGHTLAAAGAIEAAVTAMAVARGVVPPTAGLDDPDPDLALEHIPHRGRALPVRAALSSSFGFGGMDAVLVITEPGRGRPPPPASARRVWVTGGAVALEAEVSRVTAGRAAPPAARGLSFDPTTLLDRERARRLDPAARLATATLVEALREADAQGGPAEPTRTGIAIGWAFGGVDAIAAFSARIGSGDILNPAAFPSLVPSSIAGHASIYLGLRGPALITADAGRSAESAALAALDAIEDGDADVMLVAGLSVAGSIARRALAGVHPAAGSQGAAGLVLEDEPSATARGRLPLARVLAADEGRGPLRLPEGRPRGDRARVVLARPELATLVAGSPWDGVPPIAASEGAADLEASFAHALVLGVSLIARRTADEVLVVGGADGDWAWVLLGA